jgi:hypothetical protein
MSAAMFWAMLAVALGFLGTAVLGVLAVRVFLEARRLGSQVEAAAPRLAVASADLEQAAERTARAARTL